MGRQQNFPDHPEQMYSALAIKWDPILGPNVTKSTPRFPFLRIPISSRKTCKLFSNSHFKKQHISPDHEQLVTHFYTSNSPNTLTFSHPPVFQNGRLEKELHINVVHFFSRSKVFKTYFSVLVLKTREDNLSDILHQ